MEWFKHYSGAHMDPLLIQVVRHYGMAGYGQFWRLCEVVGGQMKHGSAQHSVTMDMQDWAGELKMYPKNLLPFLGFLAENNTITAEVFSDEYTGYICGNTAVMLLQSYYKTTVKRKQSGINIKLSIPKMLELRDSRNQARQPRGSCEALEVDKSKSKNKKEKEIHKEKPAAPTEKKKPKGRPVPMPKEMLEMFESGTGVPEDFVTWAKSKGVQTDVREIFERFCENHLKKGSEWVSWRAAWQMWIRNAKQYNPEYFLKIANTDMKADYLYQTFLENIGDGEPHYADWVKLRAQLKQQCPKHVFLEIEQIREKYGKK